MALDKRELLERLGALLTAKGLSRVHPDTSDPVAHAAGLALAGLPHYEQLWAGDLGASVAVVAVASGERLAGQELVRRKDLLAERLAGLRARVNAPAQALQLVLYERAVPPEERDFVLKEAKKGGLLPIGRSKVATFLFALAEPALHSSRFAGWPDDLGPPELRKLLLSPEA
ncbi:MAG: hypothetical protein ACJ79T_07480 [Myxococcales bacterium]